jgi:hypothetical protein
MGKNMKEILKKEENQEKECTLGQTAHIIRDFIKMI